MSNINELVNGHEIESASPLTHAVRYDRVQVKSNEQKQQARSNIGAAAAADLTTQTGRITKAMHMIAPDYSATSTYAVGDLVVRGDKLYVCSTAIETAEAWTAAHWTETTVAEAGVGGGGGSSGGGAFFIPITVGTSEITGNVNSITSGKTAEEITTASQTSALFLEQVGEGFRVVAPIKILMYEGPDDLGYSFTLKFDGYEFGVNGDVELKAATPGEYPAWEDDK